MSNTFEDIIVKTHMRRLAQAPGLTAMIKVRDRFNGDYVIPIYNTGDEGPDIPATAAIIANAIENTSMRAGSVMPGIFCPALDSTKETGKGSLQYADVRKRALAYTWHCSKWPLGVNRAFRHLSGYMTTALDCEWDFDRGLPKVKVRDPLTAYPEPKAPEDLSPIEDVAFIFSKSVDWLRRNYPQTRDMIGRSGYSGGVSGDTQMWDLVEWIDGDQIVIGLLGPQISMRTSMAEPLRHSMELSRAVNKAGRCTTYMPRRVTLDRIANQVANQVASTDLAARLMALDIRATEDSIYPDRYIMGKLGQAPQLVGGKWKKGSSGEVNVIIDAESVGTLRGTPDPHNSQTIDRLERNANLSMGVVPQMGGETYGALRTGRGIDSLMGAAVDPRIQELHEVMADAMTEMNEIIVECYKGYAPNRKVVGFSGWATDRGQVEFTPATHLETTENAVIYAIPGADVQTATITLGQLFGTQAISLRTMRQLHPYIQDGDEEARERLVEELQQLSKMALQQRAQSGMPPIDLAHLIDRVQKGESLESALIAVDREAQERQAAMAPPPQEGQAVPPETMPGLANPGEGAEMQPSPNTVPETEPGLEHFRQMVQNLRAPNRGVATAGVQQ